MQAPSRPSSTFYRPELDGLRFFAFFAVFLNHTLLLDPGRGAAWKRVLGGIGVSGAFGVDLFFALSAYLITELLLRERARTGALDVPAFYLRRILRIWPLYFAFLIAVVLVPGDELTAPYALGFGLFCGNWLYILHPLRTLAAPLWSVSVEEQFYLVWPWAVRRGGPERIARIAIGLAVASFALVLGLQLGGIGEPWLSKNSLTRADGIAAGVLLAVALRGEAPRLSTAARCAVLCAALPLLALLGMLNPFEPGVHLVRNLIVYPAAALLCSAILVAVMGMEGRAGGLLRHPALIYLGRISFGLYVFHQVGLAAADRLFPGFQHAAWQWAQHFAAGLLVTGALAAASYRFLEQPFLKLKQRRFTIVASQRAGAEGAPLTGLAADPRG